MEPSKSYYLCSGENSEEKCNADKILEASIIPTILLKEIPYGAILQKKYL